MRGCFITATDTAVGKTVLAAALVADLRARGERVRVLKPVVTGVDEPEPGVPADHELLAGVSGLAPDEVAPLRFGPAVSPHLAAQLAGTTIDVGELADAAHAAAGEGETLVVEGIGGLLVPLAPGWDVREFARELGLPVVIAARPGLGTINHTLLTLEAARAAGLDVRAVVLTPWPAAPSTMERSNRATIAQLGDVEVSTLARVAALTPAALAAAGAALPCERWLSTSSDRSAV